MDRRYTPQSARRMSRASYTDDEDQLSRMSDLEGEGLRSETTFLRRRSSSVSLAASPSSSSQKMSVDSDDARSVSSISTGRGRQLLVPPFPDPPRRLTRSLSSDLCSWTPSPAGTLAMEDLVLEPQQESRTERKFIAPIPISSRRLSSSTEKKQAGQHNRSSSASSSSTEAGPSKRSDPEKRSVTRRSSLFPKSKALARVINQADEETRLADVEMRRERDMTQQLKTKLSTDLSDVSRIQSPMPAVPWARISPTMAPYQCSKLNPEMEMTNFQFENLPSPMQQGYKSIKRKASEDRFETYSSSSLKRRAVSPSVSASGSPVLTGISSPPYALYGSSPTSNAAARAQQKPAQLSSSSFNLQDASGSLSRMSLSE